MKKMETIREYHIGDAIILEIDPNNPITSVDGVIVDPDVVTLTIVINGNADQTYTFTYTYGVGDPTGTIVRMGLGLYRASINTLAVQEDGVTPVYYPGTWVYIYQVAPSEEVGHDATQTQAVRAGQILVEPYPA